MKKILRFIAVSVLLVVLAIVNTIFNQPNEPIDNNTPYSEIVVEEDGYYTSKEEVAAYLIKYEKLPSNYITKTKASRLGWVAEEGNLWEVTDQMSIGGGEYKNFEGLLPEKEGRIYRECDIDYEGGHRNSKRIVYSNDGLIYYTDDHYESFTLLYPLEP